MGLSFAFLVLSETGAVDLQRPTSAADAEALMTRLFPRTPYRRVDAVPLIDVGIPPREAPAVVVLEDGALIVTRDAHLYDPEILHRRYRAAGWPDVRLLTSRSINDMTAYGRWRDGVLVRQVSVNAVAGVWRDDGEPEVFEGGEPVAPSRWLDLANAALAETLRLPGDAASLIPGGPAWEQVTLHRFARSDR